MSFQPNNRTPLLPRELNQFRSAYSEKLEIAMVFPEDSEFTRQEFADECDINNIMKQYLNTGEFFHINETAPQYLDCTGEDFRTHMDYIAGAFSMFEELPSSIRSRFDNDPAEFLDFCSQEKNRPELAEMGLLSPEAVERMSTPAPAPSAPPSAPQPASEPEPKTD
jgi:phage internal scaffolding protein